MGFRLKLILACLGLVLVVAITRELLCVSYYELNDHTFAGRTFQKKWWSETWHYDTVGAAQERLGKNNESGIWVRALKLRPSRKPLDDRLVIAASQAEMINKIMENKLLPKDEADLLIDRWADLIRAGSVDAADALIRDKLKSIK
jgi:hypothetical protein